MPTRTVCVSMPYCECLLEYPGSSREATVCGYHRGDLRVEIHGDSIDVVSFRCSYCGEARSDDDIPTVSMTDPSRNTCGCGAPSVIVRYDNHSEWASALCGCQFGLFGSRIKSAEDKKKRLLSIQKYVKKLGTKEKQKGVLSKYQEVLNRLRHNEDIHRMTQPVYLNTNNIENSAYTRNLWSSSYTSNSSSNT